MCRRTVVLRDLRRRVQVWGEGSAMVGVDVGDCAVDVEWYFGKVPGGGESDAPRRVFECSVASIIQSVAWTSYID